MSLGKGALSRKAIGSLIPYLPMIIQAHAKLARKLPAPSEGRRVQVMSQQVKKWLVATGPYSLAAAAVVLTFVAALLMQDRNIAAERNWQLANEIFKTHESYFFSLLVVVPAVVIIAKFVRASKVAINATVLFAVLACTIMGNALTNRDKGSFHQSKHPSTLAELIRETAYMPSIKPISDFLLAQAELQDRVIYLPLEFVGPQFILWLRAYARPQSVLLTSTHCLDQGTEFPVDAAKEMRSLVLSGDSLSILEAKQNDVYFGTQVGGKKYLVGVSKLWIRENCH